ncbi:MAG TPA: peptide-methionine (R)-S-oxide reductase MsrB [Gammaproteobacteria bacterium]|nr:peptide-methionine (R)-S-oxide reductase MsrB [Gammaproteobacteria bacterium]
MDSQKIARSESEWREVLTPEQFASTRQGATDRPFTGRYVHPGPDGIYRCVCCEAELFDAADQFDSGSGWPSFTRAIEAGRVTTLTDRSHGMVRTEIRCAHCDAHLGHLFPDGPAPSGERFCVNSTALELDPADT